MKPLIAILCLAFCLTAYAQQDTKPTHPLAPLSTMASTTTERSGLLQFNFTIFIRSKLGTSGTIACTASASIADDSSGKIIRESAGGQATISGSKATCTVLIPYTWFLASPGTDEVALEVSVSGEQPLSGGTGLIFAGPRTTTQTLGTIPVPANGAQIGIPIEATL